MRAEEWESGLWKADEEELQSSAEIVRGVAIM